MKITEVRVKLVGNKNNRVKAFCSMTIDNEFVIRDVKVIEGASSHFIAMPSRKMSDHCEKCGGKNHLRAKFCNNCGASLPASRVRKDFKGRMKLHADIAHPINAECRRTVGLNEPDEEVPGKPVGLNEPDEEVPGKPVGLNEPDEEVPGKPVGLNEPDEEVPGKPVGLNEPDEEVPGKPVGLNEPDDPDDDEVPEIV